jgi:hypothetical protein
MHAEQTIPCLNTSKTCGISVAQSSPIGSDFALCTSSDQSQQICDFYKGWPATKVRQAAPPVREGSFYTHRKQCGFNAGAWIFVRGL